VSARCAAKSDSFSDVFGEVTVCCRYEEVMISMESEIIDLLRVSICHHFSSEFIQICVLNVAIAQYCMKSQHFIKHAPQADQEALSIEAARYLEDGSPVQSDEFSNFGESGVHSGDDGCMQDDSAEDSLCHCPLCHSQPLFFQMGWFLCVCGFRLSVKAEPISFRQLKSLLQQSTYLHQSSGCGTAPRCGLKVGCDVHALATYCEAFCLYTRPGFVRYSILGNDMSIVCIYEYNCLKIVISSWHMFLYFTLGSGLWGCRPQLRQKTLDKGHDQRKDDSKSCTHIP
jgi:hypothetical protein